ncbi:hypothetical protein NRB_02180 [Novosphingobium sp. 11B]
MGASAALASPDRLDDLDPAVIELVKALARAAVSKEIRRLRRRDSEAYSGVAVPTLIDCP